MAGSYDNALWALNKRPEGHISVAWQGARYESGRRPFTAAVEGRISPDHHLVMLTLAGGAERHSFRTDDGFSYDGRDRAGVVSFLPAGCGRDLELRNVCWRWGAIAIEDSAGQAALRQLAPFVSAEDGFIAGLIAEMDRLLSLDGGLDATWCDTMVAALVAYLGRRHRGADSAAEARHRLAPWQVRATYDRIEAGLAGPLRIAELSAPLGLSEGHFFRAFRGSTGRTPLAEIMERRLARAALLLAGTEAPVSDVAFDVGFVSQSHLARAFRKRHGMSPTEWRRARV